MRDASTQVRELIREGGSNVQWVFDLLYDGDRRLTNVPVEQGASPTWDGSRFVVGAGNVRVVWDDDAARSMIPRSMSDWFAPFGAELQVDCIVGAGVFSERIPQGRFVVTAVPDATEAGMLWDGRLIHAGESFTLTLKDRLAKVQRDDFPYPTAPRSTSAWSEIQSITGLPVVRNVPDVTVPDTPYEGSREEALKAIFDRLDAWPHLDSSGALTSRPKAWPDPVDQFVNVVAAPPRLTSEDTWNRVAVTGRSPEGEPVYSVREVRSGPLRVRNADGTASPFGGATFPYKSDKLSTQAEVDDYANGLLPRVSRVRSQTREVVETFNPLREVGDVVTFADTARYGGQLNRIRTVTHQGGVTKTTVEVADE